MRLRALAAVLSLAAAPAFAACPTAADLESGGVWIDFSDGSLVRYQRLKPEVVGEANYQPEGVEDFFTARYRGIWLLLDAPLKDDAPDGEEIMSFQPSAGESDWPVVAPGAAWSGEITTRRADGSFVNTFKMSAQVVGEETVHVSGCKYEADIVHVEERYGDGDSRAEIRHLRALGVAYIAASGQIGAEFEYFAVPTWIGDERPR